VGVLSLAIGSVGGEIATSGTIYFGFKMMRAGVANPLTQIAE
jgi:hypothetical protein